MQDGELAENNHTRSTLKDHEPKVYSGFNSHSEDCTAASGSLCEYYQYHAIFDEYLSHFERSLHLGRWEGMRELRPERTGQGLAIIGGSRRSNTRVLQLAKLSTSLGSLGFDTIDNRA